MLVFAEQPEITRALKHAQFVELVRLVQRIQNAKTRVTGFGGNLLGEVGEVTVVKKILHEPDRQAEILHLFFMHDFGDIAAVVLMQFVTIESALLIAGVSLGLHTVSGYMLTPWLTSRTSSMSART